MGENQRAMDDKIKIPRVPEKYSHLKRVKIILGEESRIMGMLYAKRLAREKLGIEVEFLSNINDDYYFVENTYLGKKYIEWYYIKLSIKTGQNKDLFNQ